MAGTKREFEMVEMRLNGATYKAIGEHFGVTKQRVYEIIHRRCGKISIGIKGKIDIEDIVYEGIYRHFKDNPEQTFKKFCEGVCGFYTSAIQERMKNFLTGKHETLFKVKHIKKICEVCKMPFEEVFKERER